MSIHPTAIIHPTARIDDSADIGPYVQVGAECEVGPGSELMLGAVLHARVRMGARNRVHPHAVLGGEPQFLGFDRTIRSGVVIGDDNEFREGSTVHRGLYPDSDTVIGHRNFVMVSAHVAHDCVLGNNITLVNYCGLSGHVHVEDRAFISGHVGVHQFARIGTLAMVGAMSGVSQDVPPYCTTRDAIAFIVGLNVVGMRRAGVAPEARLAIRRAFKTMFRSGHALPRAIAEVREEWQGREMPKELAHFVDFCAAKSKRGIMSGFATARPTKATALEDDEN